MGIFTIDEAADTATCSRRAELMVREENGIAVTLFWVRATDVVLLAVADHRSGTFFELVLERDDRALDVFHHPYAYAAARGIDTSPTVSEPEMEVIDA
jgi:hypothetical protein